MAHRSNIGSSSTNIRSATGAGVYTKKKSPHASKKFPNQTVSNKDAWNRAGKSGNKGNLPEGQTNKPYRKKYPKEK